MDDPMDQGEQNTAPPLCAKGCGFFGNPLTLNLCSKCYRETQRQVQVQPAPMPSDECVAIHSAAVGGEVVAPLTTPAAEAAMEVDATTVVESAPTPSASTAPLGRQIDFDLSAPSSTPNTSSISELVVPEAAAPPSTPATPATPTTEIATPATTALVCGSCEPPTPPERKVQTNTSRCWTCNKKIGLTGFKCKCEYFYCPKHRYPEAHSCDFDYKTKERNDLAKANPKIIADRMQKI